MVVVRVDDVHRVWEVPRFNDGGANSFTGGRLCLVEHAVNFIFIFSDHNTSITRYQSDSECCHDQVLSIKYHHLQLQTKCQCRLHTRFHHNQNAKQATLDAAGPKRAPLRPERGAAYREACTAYLTLAAL